MPPSFLLLSAVAVGAAVPVQSAINAQMGGMQGHPLYGALTNTAVATLIFVLLILGLRIPAPDLQAAASGPAWLWLGGCVRRRSSSAGCSSRRGWAPRRSRQRPSSAPLPLRC